MTRQQLNIKLETDAEKAILATAKAKAYEERITLKELVLDALKLRLEAKGEATVRTADKSTDPEERLTKGKLDDFKRRLVNVEFNLKTEISRDRKKIDEAIAGINSLAAAIAEIEERLTMLETGKATPKPKPKPATKPEPINKPVTKPKPSNPDWYEAAETYLDDLTFGGDDEQ